MREDSFTEVAAVNFKYKAMLLLGTTNKNYVWSTFSKYNNLQRDNFLLATVKTKQVDADLDGRNEYLNLELSLPVPDTENVQSVELLLFFEYRLIVSLVPNFFFFASIDFDPWFSFNSASWTSD